jgi:hypothetical protein|eukprot:COSAG01_NODE_1575_length_9856_cov_33.989956_9_plen_49_part_00
MQEKAGREEARKQRLKAKQAAERASAKVPPARSLCWRSLALPGGVAQR